MMCATGAATAIDIVTAVAVALTASRVVGRKRRCDRDRHRDRCCGGVDCFEGSRQEVVDGRGRP